MRCDGLPSVHAGSNSGSTALHTLEGDGSAEGVVLQVLLDGQHSTLCELIRGENTRRSALQFLRARAEPGEADSRVFLREAFGQPEDLAFGAVFEVDLLDGGHTVESLTATIDIGDFELSDCLELGHIAFNFEIFHNGGFLIVKQNILHFQRGIVANRNSTLPKAADRPRGEGPKLAKPRGPWGRESYTYKYFLKIFWEKSTLIISKNFKIF